jgi:hypothetical protein
MTIVMRQSQKTELAQSTAETGQHDSNHLDSDSARIVRSGGQRDKQHTRGGYSHETTNAHGIRRQVYKVRRNQFDKERGHHIGQENDTFWYSGTDKVERGGEDDDIENIVDETWRMLE